MVFVNTVKRDSIRFLEWFGELGEFCIRIIRAPFSPGYQIKELIKQMDEVGSKSLPIVALAGSAVGCSSIHAFTG
ncbi:hypothetical protein L0156_09135 [bacterium]|nr:hypothetical protein [bacterium]